MGIMLNRGRRVFWFGTMRVGIRAELYRKETGAEYIPPLDTNTNQTPWIMKTEMGIGVPNTKM